MNDLNEIFKDSNFAVTVCDLDCNVIYMNEKAGQVFQKYGGLDLIGKSLLDCHLPSSCDKIRLLLEEGSSNTYTIEKGGIKKIIHQTPWRKNGKIAGLIELSLELPPEMPNFIRS